MGIRVGNCESIIAASDFLGDCTCIGAGISRPTREYELFGSGIRYEVTFIGCKTQAVILGVVEGRRSPSRMVQASNSFEKLWHRGGGLALGIPRLVLSDMKICSKTIGDQPWSLGITQHALGKSQY